MNAEGTSTPVIVLRRLFALIVILGLLGGVAWVITLVRDSGSAAPATTSAPPLKVLRIVFPEGYTRDDMATQIRDVNKIAEQTRNVTPKLSPGRYLDLTASSKFPGRFARDGKRRTLEGFLFPATYEFTKHTTTERLVRDQLDAFRENWSQVNMRYARSKNLTPWDVLIIASMIEKEVAAPEERALVSSVIYNRLKARTPLGIDATIRYGLHIPPTEPLHESQLHDPSPYNTRVHLGLPPGPISNPGLASMLAAANPRHTKYLYYVRKPDKEHHAFFTNKADFDAYQAKHGY
ncbi:MAG TPA: endolytic transglycosylase MltG [Gaiellaceae bacterium]|nr:endolytic transglycosylase MltG [Gaiellaceae bacterium]